jgi:hypothetical protein
MCQRERPKMNMEIDKDEYNMKKLNPKVTKVVIALLSVLIAGGATIAIKEGIGPDGNGDGDDDTGLW